MELKLIKTPFPHVIVENLYSTEELEHIWKELNFLSYLTKLTKPSTNSLMKKDNYSLNLSKIYKEEYFSNIITLSRKLFQQELIRPISQFDISFLNILSCNKYNNLVSYYEDGNDYYTHRDSCVYTNLSWFYKEPKQYSGGDLYFPEYDYTIEAKNNRSLYFISSLKHQATKLQMPRQSIDDYGSFSGLGRYAISKFFEINYSTV